ncbi:hypothetical protein GPECTOR_19g269 [Gonium pectorale]|uniref:Uncharacterized protein n=1 Tax=Gonium pectorale TaxID=33097 RepID=A0A150GJ44_GONPE|nr:hypothetical protein GPECTOR_19g269 [Gonium pectorale]|eukprot:KXZ49818.1 hypothetical protein GPECTOR_19g269 [Gonium pectorale]
MTRDGDAVSLPSPSALASPGAGPSGTSSPRKAPPGTASGASASASAGGGAASAAAANGISSRQATAAVAAAAPPPSTAKSSRDAPGAGGAGGRVQGGGGASDGGGPPSSADERMYTAKQLTDALRSGLTAVKDQLQVLAILDGTAMTWPGVSQALGDMDFLADLTAKALTRMEAAARGLQAGGRPAGTGPRACVLGRS